MWLGIPDQRCLQAILLEQSACLLERAVGRVIIQKDDFEIPVSLLGKRADALPKVVRVVPAQQQDGKGWSHGRHSLSLSGVDALGAMI